MVSRDTAYSLVFLCLLFSLLATFFMLPFDGRRGMKAKVGVGKSFATMVVFRGLFLHGLVDERQWL